MKEVFVVILVCLFVVVIFWEGEFGNSARSRQVVMETLKAEEVQLVPGLSHSYIARLPDGSVWFVEYSVLKGRVAAKTLLFPAK